MIQKIISFVFIYLMTFWLLIFIALPIGVKRNEKPGGGHDHGAPRNHHMKRKVIWTAAISLVIVIIYFYLKENGYIDVYSYLEGK